MNKKQLKETIRPLVKKYLSEQMGSGGGDQGRDIAERIERYVDSWIRTNLSKVQEELESSAAFSPDVKPTGSEFREIFIDQIIANASDMDILKAISQQQERVNSIIDRSFSKAIDKDWELALEMVRDMDVSSKEDQFDSMRDPYAKYGVSRDDF